MKEDISKIISKYKMYMSFNGNEYQMIEKVELNKTFEEWKKAINIIKEVREYITKQVHRNQQFYEMDIENILEILGSE